MIEFYQDKVLILLDPWRSVDRTLELGEKPDNSYLINQSCGTGCLKQYITPSLYFLWGSAFRTCNITVFVCFRLRENRLAYLEPKTAGSWHRTQEQVGQQRMGVGSRKRG